MSMPGSGHVPASDPTFLTTEQLLRSVANERDYVNGQVEVILERLAGIDKATELRLGGIVGIPDQIEEKVSHLKSLMDEKFNSVANQFKERDVRSERETVAGEKALKAALDAQKESAAEQNRSNSVAVTKSEAATTEAIAKLGELSKSTTDGLASKIEDLKDNVGREIAAQSSRLDLTQGRSGGLASGYGIVVAGASLVLTLLTIAAFAATRL